MNSDTIKTPKITPAGIPKIISVAKTFSTATKPMAHFTNFTTEEGLVLSTIMSSYFDKSGNLWFGTMGGGISKYDGKSFTNFTKSNGLGNNVILCITEDKSGNLWFGTNGGGVAKYDGKSFTNFTTSQGLLNNFVFSIMCDKVGNLWFGTFEGGVSKYNGKDFEVVKGLPKYNVWCITEDNDGNIWFGTHGGGISKYNGKSFVHFTNAQGLSNNLLKCAKKDKQGNLWFGTDGGSIYKYDGKSFTNYPSRDGLPVIVNCITEDKKGNIWMGLNGAGFTKFDRRSFSNINSKQGLSINDVKSISEDKNGNLWLGTYGAGVSRYEGPAFVNFSSAQGLNGNNVYSIIEDSLGNLWFGSYGGGVSKYDGKSFTNFTKSSGLLDESVVSVAKDKKGNLWFGTAGYGVSKYDGKSFMNYTQKEGLSNNVIFSILEDKNGNIWFSNYGKGICKFDGETFISFTTAQGLADNVVLNITEDSKGNLWFGTKGGGISKYDGKTFTNFTKSSGLLNNTITRIKEDKNGNLWLGSDIGLSCITFTSSSSNSRNDNIYGQIKNYTTANGLPDGYITQILEFPNGKIALGTNNGVAIFNPSLPLDSSGRLAQLELFNSSTGFPIKDVNSGQNCLYQDKNGKIWIGTGDPKIALVRFDYSAINRNLNSPTIVLQKIKLNQENICFYSLSSNQDSVNKFQDSVILAQQEMLTYNKILSDTERNKIKNKFNGIKFDSINRYYPIPINLTLPYEHNNVTFEFNCIEVSKHNMVNYQYMLTGYDKNWSPVLKKQEANYGNINEGTHTFRLKAQNPEGIWCEPITFTFNVLPPWWRTWWMYTVYGIITVATISAIVWWNGRKLRKRAKELKLKVDEATFEIKEQKHLIEEKHKEITDSINYAERIQRSFLATKSVLDENLKDYFVMFQPKDVVSGDFYWASKLSNGNFALATADSTGHGVPGAIMSLLNITSLERAIETLNNPSEILNSTRKTIIERLKKDGSEFGGKDGMDCSLISFDFKNHKLIIAAANNPVWIVRGIETIDIKPDKMPVGKHDKDSVSFTQQEIELQKGDVVYTLTDGFPDQFGGEKGKKFMSKNLRELLATNAHLPMDEQKTLLTQTFQNWVGDLEQVDDVTLIGVRI